MVAEGMKCLSGGITSVEVEAEHQAVIAREEVQGEFAQSRAFVHKELDSSCYDVVHMIIVAGRIQIASVPAKARVGDES